MKKVAIIGAGISGLFIANLFKRNPNYQIRVYEKNTLITLEEGYGVQLSVNSIRILNEIGFQKLENNKKFTPKKLIFTSSSQHQRAKITMGDQISPRPRPKQDRHQSLPSPKHHHS